MTVLVTHMKANMRHKVGYINIDDLMQQLDVYTFNQCIKITNANNDIHQWVLYWEEFPIAVRCDVQTKKLINGFLQVVVLTKKVVEVSDIGEALNKNNYWYAYFDGEKLVNINELKERSRIQLGIKEKDFSTNKQQYTQSEIDEYKRQIAENWNIIPK